ncbi:hypothetical protein CVS29_11150 [Arthrobacter psychrochitiniphilus]|uniref:AbiEi antitoxin C-terminal domain-containing protein n=2 Tax=Arthrobacter psychrochitiniphilus TaxID=291045 RepID=A0A2V3DQG4_9MICC|nr:hypothetical protein CVS29_11150 [Arthrobacter psychrochitiniphilus]
MMRSHATPPEGPTAVLLLAPGTQFTASELSAMTLDGVICHVFGQIFRPSSLPETPTVRAAALALAVPAYLSHRAVLGQLSAAWVHGCAPLPEVISLLVANDGNSVSLPRSSGASIRQVSLAVQEVMVLGGTPVTRPLRTAVDVARSAPELLARTVLQTMAEQPLLDCSLERLLCAIQAAPHVPGKIRAQELVQAMMGHPPAIGGTG